MSGSHLATISLNRLFKPFNRQFSSYSLYLSALRNRGICGGPSVETARFEISGGAVDFSGSFGCTGAEGPEDVLLSNDTPADFAIDDGVEEPVKSFFFSGAAESSNVLFVAADLSCSSLRWPSLNGVEPAFELKFAGFEANIEVDGIPPVVQLSSLASSAGLFKLNRLLDLSDEVSALGENRPPLDWFDCEKLKLELDSFGFLICDDGSAAFGENRLFEVVGVSAGFEGDPKLNSGFEVLGVLSLCDLLPNKLANGFFGPASSLC